MNEYEQLIVADGFAYCEKCWKKKSADEFHSSATPPRGTYPWCRVCVAAAGFLPEPLYNCEQPMIPNPILSGGSLALRSVA